MKLKKRRVKFIGLVKKKHAKGDETSKSDGGANKNDPTHTRN